MGARAAVYTRVSSNPSDTGRTVAEQEADCRAVGERHSWDVVAVFTDNDCSASRYASKVPQAHRRLIELIEDSRANGSCHLGGIPAHSATQLTTQVCGTFARGSTCS